VSSTFLTIKQIALAEMLSGKQRATHFVPIYTSVEVGTYILMGSSLGENGRISYYNFTLSSKF
jgi:hypothetical protein